MTPDTTNNSETLRQIAIKATLMACDKTTAKTTNVQDLYVFSSFWGL
jgi:hypothetical protein